MLISDWSSDVCSSDLLAVGRVRVRRTRHGANAPDVRLGGKFRLQVGLLRSAHAGARGIAALRHEAVDHPVKQNAVVKAFAGQFLDPLDMAGSKVRPQPDGDRSEEHTSELQSLMRL